MTLIQLFLASRRSPKESIYMIFIHLYLSFRHSPKESIYMMLMFLYLSSRHSPQCVTSVNPQLLALSNIPFSISFFFSRGKVPVCNLGTSYVEQADLEFTDRLSLSPESWD